MEGRFIFFLDYLIQEFFFADCFDQELKNLLGQSGFRVEEIPEAINLLKIIGAIASPKSSKEGGLGRVDLAKEFANPSTRFSASCLSWFIVDGFDAQNPLKGWFISQINEFINKERKKMMEQNKTSPLVGLAQLAQKIQRKRIYNDSNSHDEFLYRVALEAASGGKKDGSAPDRNSLVFAVAGKILADSKRRNDGNKGFYASQKNREEDEKIPDAIQSFSEYFVDEVWIKLYKQNQPSASVLSRHLATYTWSLTYVRPETPVA